jgi:hypothetical protein
MREETAATNHIRNRMGIIKRRAAAAAFVFQFGIINLVLPRRWRVVLAMASVTVKTIPNESPANCEIAAKSRAKDTSLLLTEKGGRGTAFFWISSD